MLRLSEPAIFVQSAAGGPQQRNGQGRLCGDQKAVEGGSTCGIGGSSFLWISIPIPPIPVPVPVPFLNPIH
jgi:hypothetical protein